MVATIPSILPRRAETSLCPTSTIAHVNATHPRPELDVVSVLFCLRTYHLCHLCDCHITERAESDAAVRDEGERTCHHIATSTEHLTISSANP